MAGFAETGTRVDFPVTRNPLLDRIDHYASSRYLGVVSLSNGYYSACAYHTPDMPITIQTAAQNSWCFVFSCSYAQN